VWVVFHLSNKEAKRKLKLNRNNKTLSFFSEPNYLGLTLDRTQTYRRHLESLRKTWTSRVALLRRLAGSDWGARTRTLRTTILALIHSTAEVLRSCLVPQCPHTSLIVLSINEALRMWLDACFLRQQTVFGCSQASSLLSFVAMEPRCL